MNRSTKDRIHAVVISSVFRLAAGAAFSILAIILIVRNVNFTAVQTALSNVSTGYLLIGLSSVAVNTLAKTMRWRVLLGSSGRALRFSTLLIALLTGQMLNALLPVRVGDLSRVADIGFKGPGSAFVLGTVVLEKIIDLVCLALLFIFVLIFIPLPGWFGSSAYFIAAAALISLGALVLLALSADRFSRILNFVTQLLPARVSRKLGQHLQSGLNSILILRQNRQRVRIAFWTVVVWATAIATNQLILLAFGIQVTIIAACLLIVMLLVGVSIPALPGGIGIFEYLCVLGLGIFAVNPAVALTYALILHAMTLLPMILIGPVYIVTLVSMKHLF